uniref:Peptidyl-prolyl cis-trans isomerase n=1 Tax=Prymnesium polylepis TaxID=72548 RepID=A0A7S4MY14_9EUKA
MEEPNPKQAAGLESLRELRGDFDTVHSTLGKILGNIVNAPSEAKYRRLRTTNDRIAQLLAARGARQLLVGSGFVEEDEALVLPEAAEIAKLQVAVERLSAQQAARKDEEEQAKKEAMEQQRARAMTKKRAEEPAGKVAQAKASHILLKVTDDAPYEAIEKKLSAWKAEIEDAPYHFQIDRFADKAKQHSDCPSGARGGNLGFFPRGKMVEEFDAIAFEKKVGAIYGPVRTATGSHLIFLHSRIEK